MAQRTIRAQLEDLTAQVKRLAAAANHSIHTCHQGETFSQITARLDDFSTSIRDLHACVKTALLARGRSALIEKIVMAALVAIISACTTAAMSAGVKRDLSALKVQIVRAADAASPAQDLRP